MGSENFDSIIDVYFSQCFNGLPPFYELQVALPDWCVDFFEHAQNSVYPDDASCMKVAIELSRLNVQKQTGGPFGAAVFDLDSGRLISVGVNRVVPENVSVAHAEVMALSTAQKRLGCFDLSAGQGGNFGLYTSAQPCIMCLGASLWSGIKLLACGARGHEDVEAKTGFDEGPVPEDWVEQCRKRGIDVVCDVLRKEALDVLQNYAETGVVYNPGVLKTECADFDEARLKSLLHQTDLNTDFTKRACFVLEKLDVKTREHALKVLKLLSNIAD